MYQCFSRYLSVLIGGSLFFYLLSVFIRVYPWTSFFFYNPGSGFSQRSTPFQCPIQGQVIGIFQIAADGEPQADARDLQTQGFEDPREPTGRGFAVQSWIGGQDDLADMTIFQPLKQLTNLQLFRSHPAQR